MSGGYWNYDQHYIDNIAENLQKLIETIVGVSDSDDDECNRHKFNLEFLKSIEEKCLPKFIIALYLLKTSYIYAHRIDWLLSGDDGEEEFLNRLEEDESKFSKEFDLFLKKIGFEL